MDIKWIFNDNGTEVEVPLEKWVWHVIYKDGTELHQFDKPEHDFTELGGSTRCAFHRIGEVKMDQVAVFEMINTENPALRHSIEACDGMERFIHLYRRARLNIGTSDETHVTYYCFGYVLNGVPVYNFILPDGRIIVTTNRDIQLNG